MALSGYPALPRTCLYHIWDKVPRFPGSISTGGETTPPCWVTCPWEKEEEDSEERKGRQAGRQADDSEEEQRESLHRVADEEGQILRMSDTIMMEWEGSRRIHRRAARQLDSSAGRYEDRSTDRSRSPIG